MSEHYELTEEEKEIAKKATKACGLDFGGVDFVPTDEGPLLFEVNKSPQFAGFESIHTFSVFQKIAEKVTHKTQAVKDCRSRVNGGSCGSRRRGFVYRRAAGFF